MNRVRKDDVVAFVKKVSGADPGTAAYLSAFQPAVKQMMDMLGEDEVTELERLAAEWNLQGPPKEVQRLLVELCSVPAFK